MLGIIGGSGLAEFSELTMIKEHQLDTPYGQPSSPLLEARLADVPVVFLARHGNPHRIPPHAINYRANMWALQQLGVNRIIAVNAVGGIADEQDAGVLSLPNQLIDYSWGRGHTYSHTVNDALNHVDFTNPYDEQLILSIKTAAEYIDQPLIVGGVHAVTQGPRLETAAEVQRLKRDGASIVGMTGMPEAGLARELGLRYVCIALVVNKAAGLTDELIAMEEIHVAMSSGVVKVKSVIKAYCQRFGQPQ